MRCYATCYALACIRGSRPPDTHNSLIVLVRAFSAYGHRSRLLAPIGSDNNGQVDSPKTRYAQSADGTYIAYQVFGRGPDLLLAWPWISHVELLWEVDESNAWLSR